MELAAAARTGCGEVWTRRDLEALAAVKAGVGNQILRAWHAIDLQRRLTLELSGARLFARPLGRVVSGYRGTPLCPGRKRRNP